MNGAEKACGAAYSNDFSLPLVLPLVLQRSDLETVDKQEYQTIMIVVQIPVFS